MNRPETTRDFEVRKLRDQAWEEMEACSKVHNVTGFQRAREDFLRTFG